MTGSAPLTIADVRAIVPDLDHARAEAIVATGARAEEVSEAYALATGRNDFEGSGESPLSGATEEVYVILTGGPGPEAA
jgi:hypothetical protein